MTPENIKKVAKAALENPERMLRHWLPDGKVNGREFVALNPNRPDSKKGSFSINLEKGIGKDFATGEGFADLVSVVAYVEKCAQGKAAELIADFLGMTFSESDNKSGISKSRQPPPKKPPKPAPELTPIPAQASPPPASHYKRGKPSQIWKYTNKKGDALFYIYRFEPTKKGERKQFTPLSWNVKNSKWQWKGVPAPRPLYNLHKVHAENDSPVLICEGEKAADAAQMLFPDCVTTTPPNGAQSPNQADWSALENRVVYIWPDYDDPGYQFMNKVTALAFKSGAKSVYYISVKSFQLKPDNQSKIELSKGWDAANAVAEGWTENDIKELRKTPSFLVANDPPDKRKSENRRANSPPATNNQIGDLTHYFEVNKKGVFYHGIFFDKRTKDYQRAAPLWVCSPFRVTAFTRDINSENWGRLLEHDDIDGVHHAWAMPMNLLSGSCEGLRSELLRMGLQISTHQEARRRVEDYIQQEQPETRARCVNRTGWHDGVFVFPNRTIGSETDERVIFQSDSLEGFSYREKGSLEDWKKSVSLLCSGNSRLVFGVSVAFASMLLEMADAESGGFHFRGDSSTGKTTILRVSASVFGGADYMQRWRATDNSLEALAAQHSDTLLLLDEIAQVDPRVAGETAYMLANGAGKSRAGRDGNARARKTWRLLFLSAGEISLADHMAQAGKRAKAGQELRMADIPADADAGHGAWENIHDKENGAVLSRDINEATLRNYGTAGPAFIEAVIKNRESLPFEIKQLRTEFISEVLPADASGQAERVAARFALVAIGGELATAYDLTGWKPGEPTSAAKRCFADWIHARGGAGNLEHTNILSQVLRFFQTHGEARFTDFEIASHSPEKQRTINRAGFVKANQLDELTYYLLPEVFKSEVCEGYDFREVAKLLIVKGWLQTDSEGRGTRKVRLPGSKNPKRCYVFPLESMGG